MAGDFLVERVQPHAQFLRLLLVVRDALLDGAALLDLRFQPPAGALGFHVPGGQLRARFGELLLDPVAIRLRRFVALFALRHLFAQGLQFAGGNVEIDGGLGGVALQQAELAGERHAELGLQFALKLAVAARLGSLPLEGIDLAGDLFENVVDARKVLLGALQLGFREAFAGFELGDARGLLDNVAAILRLGAEDLADTPLFDDGVALRAQSGAHEDILDVAQPGGTAVDQVFALAGAVQAPGDGDLGGAPGFGVFRGFTGCGDRDRTGVVRVGIHQGHGYVCHADRFAIAGAGKNNVFHPGAAEALRRLFA